VRLPRYLRRRSFLMERVGQVTKNASALVVAKLVTSALFFVLAIVVNRALGPEKAGIYVYAITLYTIFQIIPDFGLGNISIRDVSPHPVRIRKYIRNIVTMRALLGVFSFFLLLITDIITTVLQHSDPLSGQRFWVVFVVAFLLLLEQPFSNSLSEAFIALERQVVVAYVYTIMGFVRVALSLMIILSGTSHALVLLAATYLVTIGYSIIHFYFVYRRTIRRLGLNEGAVPSEAGEAEVAEQVGATVGELGLDVGPGAGAASELVGIAEFAGSLIPGEGPGAVAEGPPAIDFDLWRYLVRAAWPLAVASAGVVLYAGMDVPLISWVIGGIKGDRAVALFNAGTMYYRAFAFLTLAINMAILPAVSIIGNKHPERLGEVWERILRYAVLFILPITVIVPVLARPILILQKHSYIQAWSVVWISMAAMNFTMLTSISYPFFVVLNKQKRIVQVIGVGLVFRAVLDIILISVWGYRGAAVTMLVTEILAFAIIYYLLSREMEHRFAMFRFAVVPTFVIGVLYAAVFFLQKWFVTGKTFKHAALETIPWALLISVIIVVIYIALVVATRAVSRKGLQELNELLKVE
jgi:O-antigen/teichoic acid export membrane protein